MTHKIDHIERAIAEIRVEDGQKLGPGLRQTGSQCAGLEAAALDAMQHPHIHPTRSVIGRASLGQGCGVVGRIVQHLDFQPIARIIQGGRRIHQALDHMALVENRQLDRHRRPVAAGHIGRRRLVGAVAQIQERQDERLHAIKRQPKGHDGVHHL